MRLWMTRALASWGGKEGKRERATHVKKEERDDGACVCLFADGTNRLLRAARQHANNGRVCGIVPERVECIGEVARERGEAEREEGQVRREEAKPVGDRGQVQIVDRPVLCAQTRQHTRAALAPCTLQLARAAPRLP